jgi:hypothetical protein
LHTFTTIPLNLLILVYRTLSKMAKSPLRSMRLSAGWLIVVMLMQLIYPWSATQTVSAMPSALIARSSEPTPLATEIVDLLKLHARFTAVTACNATGWNCGPRCSSVTPGTVFLGELYHKPTSVYGYVAANPTLQRIIVSFRGSANINSWIQNLDFVKTALNLPNDNGAKVHRGFYECYTGIKNQLNALITSALATYPGYTVTVTGYSLGAAVAIIASAHLRNNFPSANIQTFTYGSPRVGDAKFANYISRLFPATSNVLSQPLRVVNYNDMVPRLPPQWVGFLHHDREVWIPSVTSSGALLCATGLGGEDPECSMSLPAGINVDPHYAVTVRCQLLPQCLPYRPPLSQPPLLLLMSPYPERYKLTNDNVDYMLINKVYSPNHLIDDITV